MKDYIITKAKKLSEHKACVKQEVYAMIEIDGKEIFGSNQILNADITECPRDKQDYISGAGYHLCKEICNQESHAEINAIKNAEQLDIDIQGAKLTLVGHTYCCDDCKYAMAVAGIIEVEIL